MTLRPADVADLPAVLGLLDDAVAWLVARGRTAQWGHQPWSARPASAPRFTEMLASGGGWLAELAGEPVGVLVIGHAPPAYVAAIAEPETYVHLLVTARQHAGFGIGTTLLDHARTLARAAGTALLRVDCFAGADGKLVRYYVGAGFTPAERFTVGDWPGQILAQRLA
ncbi:MAG TPA: GNAT family N-acetyltransferase [Pseudonocardiaceae bacterium]|nr:GNAT family N-acetyltransferase [Pseudonocardiaceae bacterium]